jgi:DNA-binding transcriptional LysR family regulator
MTAPAASALDWEQIRLFIAVARGGSLAAAAQRLGLDISTISRRLDRLETQVGAPLFDRTREGTLPTALAEQMLPHAEEMEVAAARFSAAGAKIETEIEGTVRLAVMPTIAELFVAPKLTALHARHPRLVVELDVAISYADLTRREADLAIRVSRPTSGDLVSMQLVSTRTVPMGSPDYVRALGRLARWTDARWLDWGAELAHLPSVRWLHQQLGDTPRVFRTNHFASQLAAARAGLGLVLAAEPFLTTGLAAVRPGKALASTWEQLPVERLWLVGHRALRQVPRVAAVWDFVVETFRGHPETDAVDR